MAYHVEDCEVAIRYRLGNHDPPFLHRPIPVGSTQLNGCFVRTDAEAELIELGVDVLNRAAVGETQLGDGRRVEVNRPLAVGNQPELILVEELRGRIGELVALGLGDLLQVTFGLVGADFDRFPDL